MSDGTTIRRVPVNHRATGMACPEERGPGMIQPACDSEGFVLVCENDSDCTAGDNGRCEPLPFSPVGCQVGCSYDECFKDTDCPAGQPCDCRASATDNTANVCVSGSQCQVDADCGPGGYCSPSGGYGTFGCDVAYFCHTAADTCVDDTDCEAPGCQYDSTAGYWRCGGKGCAPPP
jgi:hypothetical protein